MKLTEPWVRISPGETLLQYAQARIEGLPPCSLESLIELEDLEKRNVREAITEYFKTHQGYSSRNSETSRK